MSQALQFHKLGYTVVLFDYRGFGQSDGDFPIETQVYEDGQTAWTYLTQTRKVAPSKIVIYGHSIGGGGHDNHMAEPNLQKVHQFGDPVKVSIIILKFCTYLGIPYVF